MSEYPTTHSFTSQARSSLQQDQLSSSYTHKLYTEGMSNYLSVPKSPTSMTQNQHRSYHKSPTQVSFFVPTETNLSSEEFEQDKKTLKDLLGTDPVLRHSENTPSRKERIQCSVMRDTTTSTTSPSSYNYYFTHTRPQTPLRDQYNPEKSHDELLRINDQLRAQNNNLRGELASLKRQLSHQSQFKQAYQKAKADKEELERQYTQALKIIKNLERPQLEQERKLYKDIVEQLQKRVEVLLQENDQLHESVRKGVQKLEEFKAVREKADRLKSQYGRLQKMVQEDAEDWEVHKQLWLAEKEYYKEIIRKLEFQLSLSTETR